MNMKVSQREKKKVKFRISFVFLFIIVSFAVCFALYMKEDFVITEDMFDDSSEAVVYIEPVGQNNIVVNPVPKSERTDDNYYNSTVFIGSTVLSGLSDYGYVKAENMLLSDSIRLDNFSAVILSENGNESTILEAVESKNVSDIYIMVGFYELENLGNDKLLDGLEEFIKGVKENIDDADIYIMSVLPVPASVDGMVASNADIDAYNSLLLEFANKMQVHYLDVNTDFKGNDGKLSAADAEINGIRLKKETYDKLSEYILTHVDG